jgi:hypothetical protein
LTDEQSGKDPVGAALHGCKMAVKDALSSIVERWNMAAHRVAWLIS